MDIITGKVFAMTRDAPAAVMQFLSSLFFEDKTPTTEKDERKEKSAIN